MVTLTFERILQHHAEKSLGVDFCPELRVCPKRTIFLMDRGIQTATGDANTMIHEGKLSDFQAARFSGTTATRCESGRVIRMSNINLLTHSLSVGRR